jgi:hypothetical protein
MCGALRLVLVVWVICRAPLATVPMTRQQKRSRRERGRGRLTRRRHRPRIQAQSKTSPSATFNNSRPNTTMGFNLSRPNLSDETKYITIGKHLTHTISKILIITYTILKFLPIGSDKFIANQLFIIYYFIKLKLIINIFKNLIDNNLFLYPL